MRELIKMVIVLTVLTAVSGGLLAGVRAATKDRIELQVLTFVKGPVLESIFEKASNDYIADRFTVTHNGEEITIFPAVVDGKVQQVALSAAGSGYGGDIGLMVAVNIDTGKITGAGVTTHSETPGLGARAKTEPDLTQRFVGMPIDRAFKVKKDGGDITAISGATITSRGVCAAATNAGQLYSELKSEIKTKIENMSI